VLSQFANYGHASSVHESIGVLGSMEEEDMMRAGNQSTDVTPLGSFDEDQEEGEYDRGTG